MPDLAEFCFELPLKKGLNTVIYESTVFLVNIKVNGCVQILVDTFIDETNGKDSCTKWMLQFHIIMDPK